MGKMAMMWPDAKVARMWVGNRLMTSAKGRGHIGYK
jgi:hypothetical protein